MQLQSISLTLRDFSIQLSMVEITDSVSLNLERYITGGVTIEDSVKKATVEQLNFKGEWGRVSTVQRLDNS